MAVDYGHSGHRCGELRVHSVCHVLFPLDPIDPFQNTCRLAGLACLLGKGAKFELNLSPTSGKTGLPAPSIENRKETKDSSSTLPSPLNTPTPLGTLYLFRAHSQMTAESIL